VREIEEDRRAGGGQADGDPGVAAASEAPLERAADVADALANAAFSDASNATFEVAGPEQFRLDAVATEIATAYEDGRWIVADVHARYFGAELEERSLLPGPDARIASLRFDDWLRDCLQPN